MKIISFYNEGWEEEYVRSRLSEYTIDFLQGTLQDHDYLRDDRVEILSVFSTSKICAKEMDQFPNLKTVVTRSTGFDHIDLEEAKRRGLTVSNVPTYGEHTVAEYTFALLLALSRRIYEAYDRVLKQGTFSSGGIRGFDLKGKKIGVVGTGHIGQHVVRIAKGFEMDVIAFDVHEDKKMAHEQGFMYVTFDDLLGQSDIITLHAPYNSHTNHMINMENISKIKRGAYLINVARGGLVETRALVTALEQGILAGAGLDTLEEEGYMVNEMTLLTSAHPNPESLQTVLANQYLIDHPRVIITPHNAFNTKEAVERILNTTIENIKAAAQGTPINMVTT